MKTVVRRRQGQAAAQKVVEQDYRVKIRSKVVVGTIHGKGVLITNGSLVNIAGNALPGGDGMFKVTDMHGHNGNSIITLERQGGLMHGLTKFTFTVG